MSQDAFYVDSARSPKLSLGLKKLFAVGQNPLLLQETLFVVLTRAAPESVDLEERVTRLAIGVFGVQCLQVTSRFPVEQKVNGVPVRWLEILHSKVVPLRA